MPNALAHLSAGDWALVIGGVLLLLTGLAVLAHRRRQARALRVAGREDEAFQTRVSVPTRLYLGVCSGLVGYHLIAWGLGPSLLPLQLTPRLWWLWLGIALGGVALSVAIDRWEGEGPRDMRPDR